MAERPGYSCYLSAEAVSFVVGLPKQKQRKVIDLAERIAASPELIGDYQAVDAKGRPIDNLLLEEFLFTYWIDHAAKEILDSRRDAETQRGGGKRKLECRS